MLPNFTLQIHHAPWLPCEVEALCIAATVKHFSPYIIQSSKHTIMLSDSKPCFQAYDKLCRGQFSASLRVWGPVGSGKWCIISLDLQMHYQISPLVTPQHVRSLTVRCAHSLTKWRNMWYKPLLSRRWPRAQTSFSPAAQPGCPSSVTARTYVVHTLTSVKGLGHQKR